MIRNILHRPIHNYTHNFFKDNLISHQSKRSYLYSLYQRTRFSFSILQVMDNKQIKGWQNNNKQSPYLINQYSIIDDSLDKKSLVIEQMLSSTEKNAYKLVEQLIIALESFHSKRELLQNNLVKVVFKFTQKIIKQAENHNNIQFDKKFIIYYIERVKYWVLSKVQNDDKIQDCFKVVDQFLLNSKSHAVQRAFNQALKMINQFIEDPTSIQIDCRLRIACLIPYIPKQKVLQYFSKLQEQDLVKNLKTSQLVVFMYDFCQIKPQLPLELVSKIQGQSFYQNIQEINNGYIKSQFTKLIKKSMTCYHEIQFFVIFKQLRHILIMPTIKTLLRVVKIFQTETSQCLSDYNRTLYRHFYNEIIGFVTFQNYSIQNSSLKDLIQLYLTLYKIYPTGQILYQQLINFLIKYIEEGLEPSSQQIELCLLAFQKINSQIIPCFKYQKIDQTNKEYSKKTQLLNNLFMKLLVKDNPQIIFINKTLSQYVNQNNQNLAFVLSYLHTLLQGKQVKLISDSRQSNINLLKKIVQVVKATQFKLKLQVNKLQEILSMYLVDLSLVIKKTNNFQQIQRITRQSFETIYNILVMISSNKQINLKQNKILFSIESICSQLIKLICLINQQPNALVNTDKSYYNYLLLILSESFQIFTKQSSFDLLLKGSNSALTKFINKKMIFCLKSTRGAQTIKIILFLNNFKDIAFEKNDPQRLTCIQPIIFQYLYPCLSTLVRYNQQNSKYYMRNTFCNELLAIVQNFAQNKKYFKEVNQKSDFTMMQIVLLNLIKKKMIKSQNLPQILLSYMEIFKFLDCVGTDLKNIIERIKFKFQLLQQYPEQMLIQFSQISDSITKYLHQRNINSSQLINLEKLSGSLIQETFKQRKTYQIIFKNPKIKLDYQIPSPKINDIQTHMLYICQKLYIKISKYHKYDFVSEQKQAETNNNQLIQTQGLNTIPELDFEEEKAYIIQKSIVSFTDFNQFKLKENKLPKYLVTQIWKSYGNLKTEDQIQKLSITDRFDSEIYRNVILGLFGFQQKIKELAMNFHHHGFVTFMADNLGLQIKPHGCILNLFRKNNPSDSVLVICTVEHNYKLLNICAYILQKAGYNVIIISDKVSKQQVKRFLQQKFPEIQVDDGDLDKQAQPNPQGEPQIHIRNIQ